LSYLLDIEKPSQVSRDPLVGNLFENLVVIEALKIRFNKGQQSNLYFFRDSHGREIDLLYKSGREFTGVEIKSSSTWNNSFKKELNRFSEKNIQLVKSYVVYSGEAMVFSDGVEALSFTNVADIFTDS